MSYKRRDYAFEARCCELADRKRGKLVVTQNDKSMLLMWFTWGCIGAVSFVLYVFAHAAWNWAQYWGAR